MGAAGREEVWRLERVEGGGGECGGGDGEAAATVVGVMVEAGRAVVMVEGERAEEARAAVWARRGGGEGGRSPETTHTVAVAREEDRRCRWRWGRWPRRRGRRG